MAQPRLETIEAFDPREVEIPLTGTFEGQSLLSIRQLDEPAITTYLEEAESAQRIIDSPYLRGANLLPFHVLVAIMRQQSTRTGGSMRTAMAKLGGTTGVLSGMASSSEGKGEIPADSTLALAVQSDILATRTEEEFGAHYVTYVQNFYKGAKKISRVRPVINLGDGRNEHPTQTLGDLFTIKRHLLDRTDLDFSNLVVALVGDHERYRAFHSMMYGASILDMGIIAVESEAAPVPEHFKKLLGDRLQRTRSVDDAIGASSVIYVGRNPDEYTDKSDGVEMERSRVLKADFRNWRINQRRVNQMRENALLMHPRPRGEEIDHEIDTDPRVIDVAQMEYMVAMRMAIIAKACGRSIKEHAQTVFAER